MSYDTGDSAGESIESVDIETPGDHVAAGSSPTTSGFAIAVGRDPNDGVLALRAARSLAALVVGVVIGVVLLLARSPPSPRRAAARPTSLGARSRGGPGLAHEPARVPGAAADDRHDRGRRAADRTCDPTRRGTVADAAVRGRLRGTDPRSAGPVGAAATAARAGRAGT